MGQMTPVELVEEWETAAGTLEHYGDERGAALCRLHAEELTKALSAFEAEALTLSDASDLSGYSADHLGRLIREGSIPNAGRSGAPRIARRDIPQKSDVAPLADRAHHTATQIVRSAIIGEE